MIWRSLSLRFALESSFTKQTLDVLVPFLRGISQVFFQKNALSGAIILVGLLYASILLGVATLVGVVVSTLTAYILRLEETRLKDGFFGFNGALVALALITFLGASPATWIYLILVF